MQAWRAQDSDICPTHALSKLNHVGLISIIWAVHALLAFRCVQTTASQKFEGNAMIEASGTSLRRWTHDDTDGIPVKEDLLSFEQENIIGHNHGNSNSALQLSIRRKLVPVYNAFNQCR